MNFVSTLRTPSRFLPMLLAVLGALFMTGCALEPVFTYQGRLLNDGGGPVADGNYNGQFVLYTAQTGGTAVYTMTESIAVEDGLFNVELGNSNVPTEIYRQPLFMEVSINGETLSPRQPLRGAPYAFSLASGAVIQGNELLTRTLSGQENTGAALMVVNANNSLNGGHGLLGINSSQSTTDPTAAVAGIAQGEGYGGFFRSQGFRGLYAEGGDGPAGYFAGDIEVTGDCNGCTMAYYARNDGSAAIAPGDLVTAVGVEVDAVSGAPVLLVRRAASGSDAVVGVATGSAERAPTTNVGGTTIGGFTSKGGATQAGGYLSVVVQGLAQVRVSSADGVAIGDRLTASSEGAVVSAEVGGVARVMSAPDRNGLVWAMIDGR
jgi:hypothetical protein